MHKYIEQFEKKNVKKLIKNFSNTHFSQLNLICKRINSLYSRNKSLINYSKFSIEKLNPFKIRAFWE